MTIEQEYLLRCISDFCNERPTHDQPEGLNLDELCSLAEKQSLDGLVYYQSRHQRMLRNRLKEPFFSHVFLSANRRDILGGIVSRLSEEGVSLICMKGAVYRDYYQVPELRSMGDIDFVIHPEDREKVDEVMREMGFDRFIDNQAVWTYWIWKFRFEIHDHMFYENLTNRVDYRAYFDDVWEHCHRAQVFGIESDNLFVPDDEFHFLYLVAHTAKHIINSGSGFRAFIDMALMCRECSRMDWDYIREQLDLLELYHFAGRCLRLCEEWFDIKMPLDVEFPEKGFLETITESTFEEGIYGLWKKSNDAAAAAKEIRRSRMPYYIGALKRMIRLLFPKYGDLQLIPWYSFIDGRPWLTPFVWVYRWIFCIVKKRDHSKRLLTEPFVDKSTVIGRQAYLIKWGL